MYITYLLLAATILVSVMAFNDESLKRRLMFNPYELVHYGKWYRAITHAFVHANYMHLGFNMFALWMFGLSLEKALIFKYDTKGYLYFGCLYLGGILFSTITSVARHKDHPHYFSLGASGAVMAVVFAYILMFPTAELMFLFIPFPLPAYVFGPLLLAGEYYMSKRGGTGIAHDAHFAGAIFGLIFMTIIDYHYLLDFFKQFAK